MVRRYNEYGELIFETEDGEQFDEKEDCVRHEENQKKIAHLKAALEEIQDICKAGCYCQDCPLYLFQYGVCMFDNKYPAEWELLWRNKK